MEHAPSPAAIQDERDPPFRSPQLVRERHKQMVELRAQGWSMARIAEAVDLWSDNAVRYHLRGKCSCAERREGTGGR